MHVQDEIIGELAQPRVERRPRSAGSLRQRHAMGRMLDMLKKPDGIGMFMAHLCNRAGNLRV